MSAERIHINEAVRTYNKTRQTFYNWIKKDYLKAKKINNKIYVSTQDVEELLSDYIGEQPTEKTTGSEETNNSTIVRDDDDMFYELIAELQQQKHLLTQKVDDHKIGLMHEINLTKQELRTDIQRAAEGVQQQRHITANESQKKLTATQQRIETLTTRLSLINKKHSFWLGYLIVVIANITLLTILS